MHLCRMRGFEIVEVNASDTRNKSDAKLKDGINGKLSNRIKELVTNSSIHLSTAAPRRQVLVMDEVDGMSGEIHCLSSQDHSKRACSSVLYCAMLSAPTRSP